MADIVVLTAIFGRRDDLKEPRVITPGIRYVCFTDQRIESATWEIFSVNQPPGNPRRASRPYKIRPHAYLDADYSIWVDATFAVNVDVGVVVQRLADGDLAAFRHPDRDCVYAEASICADLWLDDPRLILGQVQRYSDAALPRHAGLFACGVLVRRHSREIEAFNDAWWEEYERGSERDQISFNYCVWQRRLSVSELPGNIRNSDEFTLTPHPVPKSESNRLAFVSAHPGPAELDAQLARAKIHELAGETERARRSYAAAATIQPWTADAHLSLARLALPGPDYLWHLDRFHETLEPRAYLEIGVASGATLARARPGTITIGVDPALRVPSISTGAHIFEETSDEFFRLERLSSLIEPGSLDLAFVDGLHHFEQVVRDFANIERSSNPATIVLVHDTIPLDERTQRRERETAFWTGDVWKVVPFLELLRPDLTIFTIATPPAGLTVIANLNRQSNFAEVVDDELISAWKEAPYGLLDRDRVMLRVVPNDWKAVLKALPNLNR